MSGATGPSCSASFAVPSSAPPWHTGTTIECLGDSRSGDCHGHSDAPPHFGLSAGGGQPVMIGWAYLMAAIMTIDALLLGLLLLNVKWPKRGKKN